MRKRIPLGWIDLLVSMFLVLLLASVGISGLGEAIETANRAKCASNLHQIWLAILLYQGDNQQLFPQTIGDKAENPVPVWGTPYQADPKVGPQQNTDPFSGGKAAPAANDVTASLFLLLRCEQLVPAVFVCPSTNLRDWNFGGGAHSAQDWTNWEGNSGLARHLSYSFQNPFVSKAAVEGGYQIKNPDATFAVAADMNPGGDAVTAVTIKSPPDQMQKANSLNHQQEGQNVLFGDGHSEWLTDPFCGTQHDNIYTAGGPEIKADERTKAVITASPVSGTDSILLPTATDIGFKMRPHIDQKKPLSVDDRNKLKAAIQGKYVASEDGADASMTVDDKTITYVYGGASVQLDYEVIGGAGDTLVAKLTDAQMNKHQRATLELNDGELQITTAQNPANMPLAFSWKRVKSVDAEK